MSFYTFVTEPFKKKKKVPTKRSHRDDNIQPMSLKDMMGELGVRTDSSVGTYQEEENPDTLGVKHYLNMQNNDGTVRAITRLFAMPIQSTPIKILPDENDKGERDFIENVFLGSQRTGGMSTSLPFVIADMTRAIFEGFRLYEKVPYIIKDGPYKGLIGWRKLAPRDSKTVKLRSDRKGGFLGAHQQATFGMETVNVNIPHEKCILYTFQKDRHPLYGESILRTAWYHYDKKHKLYYLAHKKAEIDAVGLKILKIGKPMTSDEVTEAETAIESIGVNSRVTLPPGVELEIDRSPSGYDVTRLIDHHDKQIILSTLAQAMSMGTGDKYAYTYGKGFETQSEFIIQMLHSTMKSMEDTLNEWAVAPLIDYNFGSGSYPKIKLMPLKSKTQEYVLKIFESLIKKDPTRMPSEFTEKLVSQVAETLGIEVDPDKMEMEPLPEKKEEKEEEKEDETKKALEAFENGKKIEADFKKLPAPSTSKQLKEILTKKAIQLKDDPKLLKKFETLGRKFVINPKEFTI